MKKNSTLNKWLRFLLPVPTGIVAYILILLVFDTLDELGSHFFSNEVAITIFFSFILLEIQRTALIFLDKKFPIKIINRHEDESENTETPTKTPGASTRIIIIPLLSLLVSIIVISTLVILYYIYIIGFKDFNLELIAFNGVFGIISMVYAIIHVSTSFLAVNKQINYIREKELRKSLEHDLENYKLQINPQLLYDSLENLISIVKHDKKMAENIINHLSGIYRYILDTRHIELVSVAEELRNLNSLIYILNIKHNGAIRITDSLDEECNCKQMVPGTISTLLTEICNRSIINKYQPLEVNLISSNEKLQFKATNHPKINLESINHWNINHLNRAYDYFSSERPEIIDNDTEIKISIPLFEIEEE
ncbi:histidine kinase [Carboxylicivirga caseinilyticus]|uniref:histidine kinase n=1 Tax=Carboxylicivirga caseinilyticus TaxID=3417572 RepID=UPI003D330619|nr:histidine kinase [Marinilabiliaceae bacterium A049]